MTALTGVPHFCILNSPPGSLRSMRRALPSEKCSAEIHVSETAGMTIDEIARRTHHDRKTIRAYLKGYGGSYPTLTRQRGAAGVHRVCACHATAERVH